MSEFDSVLHLPARPPGTPQIDAPCRVLSCQGNRLALLTDREIPVCVPLSIEHDDALYLGEVVGEVLHSGTSDTLYEVDVLIKQVLSGLQSLVTLRARLLDEASRADESLERHVGENSRVRAPRPVKKDSSS